jgi:DNA-binding LytR/AlgR family response regulator
MEKIHVLIVEDTPQESDSLIRVLEEHQFHIVGVGRSHQEALKLLMNNKVDVMVVDIYLNGVPEGITFAETISQIPDLARPFVFLTGTSDRQTFERAKLTKPYSFLLKPFNPLEVIYALEVAIEKFYDQQDVFQQDDIESEAGSVHSSVLSNDCFFIKKKDVLKKVPISTIVNIEVEDRYCTIHSLTEKFVIQISMTKILEMLDSSVFVRTHRSRIVNVDQIVEVQLSDSLLLMENKQLVPIGEKYREIIQQLRIIK